MNKVDFAIIITAENCNPNGDPTNANIPRHDYDGYGEISDVCIKRKIRDRLFECGENILNLRRDQVSDGNYSIKAKIESMPELKEYKNDPEKIKDIACKTWMDVRSFGQVIALKPSSGIVSCGIRGPVSIGIAKTLEPVDICSNQIVRNMNAEENSYKKDSGTVGMKYVVKKGVYVAYGSIYPQLAELTGFSEEDAEKIKQSMIHLLDNDASASRPSGSMSSALIWAQHGSKNGSAPSAKVHRSFGINLEEEFPYFRYGISPIPGIDVEIYD